MSRFVHLQITPDSRLDNKNVEELARALCLYLSPLERLEGLKVAPPAVLSFETVLAADQTSFYVTVPAEQESVATKAISATWPRVAVESTDDPFSTSNKPPSAAVQLTYDRHYMFSLRIDKRRLGSISSVLETLKSMAPTDRIYIQTLATPAHREWYTGAVEAYERFKKGDMPTKVKLTKKEAGKLALKATTKAVYGTASLVSEMISGEGLEPLHLNGSERALLLREGGLSSATLNKTKGDAYEVQMRIAVACEDRARAAALLRMVSSAYRELDGDNMLVPADAKPAKLFARMQERKFAPLASRDLMSIAEISRLHMLPTNELQELYAIPRIEQLETDIPAAFRKSGLQIGETSVKKSVAPVYMPTHNHDVLCLPRVVVGGMGSGKTRGFAANFVVESVRKGFGAISIDPAKGEIFEEVSAALPPEQIVRIKLGQTPLALDWREVAHSPKAKNRLANTILGFFASADIEAGGQTSRYIRAAVMAMQTGRLSEIIRIFEDADYRAEVLALMPDSIHKTTLSQYDGQSEARQGQILAPILNRLDVILGDEYLSECMDASEGVDMVELMSLKKAVIIDVPKKELGPEAVDVIVNLLTTKIDLAMTLREAQHPVFVLLDEPHQFLRSAKTWKAAAVESRKWRVGYVWLFHSWEQIPKDLAEIVKSAGPHYTLYASSKKTFKDLAEEIAPYTVEDGIKLKKYHAINVLQSDDGMQRPFIAKMAAPPSKLRVAAE